MGVGVMLFASLWSIAYENQYVTPLTCLQDILGFRKLRRELIFMRKHVKRIMKDFNQHMPKLLNWLTNLVLGRKNYVFAKCLWNGVKLPSFRTGQVILANVGRLTVPSSRIGWHETWFQSRKEHDMLRKY